MGRSFGTRRHGVLMIGMVVHRDNAPIKKFLILWHER